MTSKRELILELIYSHKDRQDNLFNRWWSRDTMMRWDETLEYDAYERIEKRIEALEAELEEIENEEV